MQKNSINNEPIVIVNAPVVAGQVLDTYFGWSGHVTLVDKTLFKFGQGIYLIILDDQHAFSIGPDDVIVPCR